MNDRRTVQGKWQSRVLYGLSLIFLILGLINLGWATWPRQQDAVQIDLPAGVLPGRPAGTNYASLAAYDLRITWPRWIRLGERGTIQVMMIPAEGEDPANQIENATQVVLIEPSMGMMPVAPAGRLQANLALGQTLDTSWTVVGEQVGDYAGKVYLSFGFYEEAADELVPVPVAVVDIAIRVTSLWGQQQPLALWLGFVGLALWGALFLLGRWVQLKSETQDTDSAGNF